MIMLDLETMGTRLDAPIIAIGAVKFNDNEIKSRFYRKVSLSSSVEMGAVIDPNTVIWWLQQDEEARAEFFDNYNAIRLNAALIEFSEWVEKEGGITTLWGNGAGFDNVILRSAYNSCGIEAPWAFWQDRCFRTIRETLPPLNLERKGVFHNALDDAENQAVYLIEVMKGENK